MASISRRVTAAFDGKTYDLLEALRKQMGTSQSDALRRMVRHYAENPAPEDSRQKKRVQLYRELLEGGEHVILDIDHLSVLLRAVGHPTPEFREALRAVARSHADQWRKSPPSSEELLERLEACNSSRWAPVAKVSSLSSRVRNLSAILPSGWWPTSWRPWGTGSKSGRIWQNSG